MSDNTFPFSCELVIGCAAELADQLMRPADTDRFPDRPSPHDSLSERNQAGDVEPALGLMADGRSTSISGPAGPAVGLPGRASNGSRQPHSINHRTSACHSPEIAWAS